MDTKSITAIIIGLMVSGLILVAFVPIFTEVTATERTFENDGYYYMQKITASDTTEHTLTYDYNDGDYIFTFDNVDITDKVRSDLTTTVATDGESWVIRVQKNEYVGLQGSGSTLSFGGHNSRTATVTFNAGTVTVERTLLVDGVITPGSTLTGSYDNLWIISNTPTDYVMKKSTTPVYMLEDSEYLAVGITGMTAWNTVIVINGDVTDFDATIVYPPNLTTTVTNKAIVKTEVNGYNDLYSLDKLTFTINDGTTTKDTIYSYFIVPSKVTAELSVHGDDAFNTVINLIPLIAGLGLLLGAVYYFITRR